MTNKGRKNIVKFFTKQTLPAAYRRQILDTSNWKDVCRGIIPHDDFAVNALESAQHIGVALSHRKKVNGKRKSPMQVNAWLFGLTSSFKTSLDGGKPKPVAKRNEWYLDVLCVRRGQQAKRQRVGDVLLDAFTKRARRFKKTALRLYSLDSSIGYWTKRGFAECDNACSMTQCVRKRYKRDAAQGVRMVKCIVN